MKLVAVEPLPRAGSSGTGPPAETASGWRLLLTTESTPGRQLESHISARRWEAALSLASSSGLGDDAVYKARWAAEPVDPNRLRETLGAVRDREWVIGQCLSRVADSVIAQRVLLDFGLAVADSALTEAARRSPRTPPAGGRTPAIGGSLWWRCQRLRLLQSRDRLETLEEVSGGGGGFDPAAFEDFSECVLKAAAAAFAQVGDVAGLGILLARHPYTLMPNLLEILSSLPETMEPKQYASLLPQVSFLFANREGKQHALC